MLSLPGLSSPLISVITQNIFGCGNYVIAATETTTQKVKIGVMGVRGHPTSPELSTFDKLHMTSYCSCSTLVETMRLSCIGLPFLRYFL